MAFRQREVHAASDIPFALRVTLMMSGACSENDILIVNGRSNGLMQAVRADADAVLTARGRLWVALGPQVNGQPVDAVPWKFVRNVNTSAWASQGDPVYMSGTPGGVGAAEGVFGVQVGECLEVSATTGAYILDPNSSYGGAPTVSGLGALTVTINDDATAAVDEDPGIRLLGGDGVAAPNNDLVRSTWRQDSSAEQSWFELERSRAGGAFARISPDFALGRQGETTASLDAFLHFNVTSDAGGARRFNISALGQEATLGLYYDVAGTHATPTILIGSDGETVASLDAILGWSAATDAGANRRATATYLGQEHSLEFASATAALALALVGTGSLGVKAAQADANFTARLAGDTIALGAGGATPADWLLDRTAADVAELGAGDSLFALGAAIIGVRAATGEANPTAALDSTRLRLGLNSADALSWSLTCTATNRADLGAGDSLLFAGGGDILGLDELELADAVADASAAGRLRRNGANPTWHDGVVAGRIFYAGGADVPVADGGTGLSAGTSGGILGFTAAGTLASSALLTANAVIIGGGAGATPTALAAMTNGQLVIGSTGLAPVVASLTAPAAGLTIIGGAGTITFALANDLAALEALGGTGLAVRSAADTWLQRSIVQPAAGITVTNGDGVGGNPTLALANDLAALEALAGTGLAVHTGVDAWTERSVVATSASIVIANGTGVAGNIGIDTVQNIQTTATPQFARLGLGAAADAAFLWAIAASGSVGLVGSNAGALTLTVDAQNAGAGTGVLVLTADDQVDVGDAGNPTIRFAGSGAVSFPGNPTVNLGTGALTIGATALSTTGALVWTLLDNVATGLSIDAAGQAGMLAFATTNGSEVVSTTAVLTTTDRVAGGTARRIGGLASTHADTSASITSTADVDAETIFSNGTYTIPANTIRAGSIVHIRAMVRVSDGATTETLIARLRLNGLAGTLLGATNNVDVATADMAIFDVFLEGHGAPGASVEVSWSGFVTNFAAVDASPSIRLASGVANFATNGALDIVMTAQWTGANAGDDVELEHFSVVAHG